MIGVDAGVGGNIQGLFDNTDGIQFGICQQGPGRRLGVGAAGANRDEAVFRLDDVAIA